MERLFCIENVQSYLAITVFSSLGFTMKDGFKVNRETLVKFCSKHLSYFKNPKEFQFIGEFSRTSIGKTQKNLLPNKQ